MRCFLALPLEMQVKNYIYNLQLDLKKSQAFNAKWVKKENLHLTVKFLGEIEKFHLSIIEEVLKPFIATIPKLQFQTGNLGVFPNYKNPRIIWLGLEGKTEALLNLYNKCDEISKALGLPQSNTLFQPHITLARIKNIKYFDYIFLQIKDNDSREIVFDKLVLYESILTPRGPIYTELQKFPFNC